MAQAAEENLFESALREMPWLEEKLSGAQLGSRERGAVSSMRTLQHVQRQNVALLGDASGGGDAITGEGLRLAFQQAIALADAMAANDRTQYKRAHRKLSPPPRMK